MADMIKFTNSPTSPDFRCQAYQSQEKFWKLCEDVKDGTPAMRDNRVLYLPKFENEDIRDYDARVLMTFANDHYAQTLTDHVGLIFAKMPELDDDVSDSMAALLENIDGEGTHWQVFLQTAMYKALDYGHSIMLTDFPTATPVRPNLKQAADQKLRPFAALYTAKDVINWRVSVIGGIRVITQLTFKEEFENDDAAYGADCVAQYRVLKQEVQRDAFGTAIGLGKITWEVFRSMAVNKRPATLTSVGDGVIKGPAQIPVRIVYGGPKLGVLETRPHLLQLAYTNLQETQLESDYASIMHKCNVPTPIFIGRKSGASSDGKKAGRPIRLGKGIDIPLGGDAKFLEPAGASIGATRQRLEDLRTQMRRQGAFVNESVSNMTATEAAIYSRQRNARLVSGARSLQDAGEGLLSDFAAFSPKEKAGGSILVALDFATSFDTAFAELCLKAYQAGVLPLDATLTVLSTGKLPDDFDAEDIALRMMAENPPEPLVQGNGIRPDKKISNDTPNSDAESTPPAVPAKPGATTEPVASPGTAKVPAVKGKAKK